MSEKAYRFRAYASLYLNCLIILMVFLASVWMMTDWIPSRTRVYSALGTAALRYFTVDSNLLMGVASVHLAVRNARILLGKEPRSSRILSVLNLAAVSGVALTGLVVVVFLAPFSPQGFGSLYLQSNLFFHFLVPVLAVLDYVFLSGNCRIRRTWCFAAILPEAVYAVYYCVPLVRYATPDGKFARGYDWYGFFGNSTSKLLPRLLLFCAGILCLIFLLHFLSELCGRRVRAYEAEKKDPAFNSISNDLESSVVTASEYYLTNVIRVICIVAPMVGLCAGGIFTALWLTGNYAFTFTEIFLFDCVCEFYLIVALFLYNTCIGQDGIVITSKVRFGKIALTTLLFLQWNLISYIAPFRDFWAYSLLFILLSALFLDSRLVLINIAAHGASILISLFFRGETLLPLPGEEFLSSMVFRISLVFLGFTVIYLLVHLIEKMLMDTLDKLSDYDVLTHALNRRQLSHSISAAIDRFRANGEVFCVAIFDLDDFKAVNDTYGHTSGDEVLVEFVRVINSSVTSSDYVFRYGGEEFLVLYSCAIENAERSCQRILRGLTAVRFAFFPEGRRQTATAGLAQYEDGMTVEELIVAADERLYYGKHHGKNQVTARQVTAGT